MSSAATSHGGQLAAAGWSSARLGAWSSSRWSLLLAFSLAGLYFASWNGQWYLSPDSAIYLMLGESLSESQSYLISGAPHTKYPPGFPLLIAGMQQIGLGDMLWLNGMMLCLGLAVLWMSYRVLASQGPTWLVVATVVCLAVNCEMYRTSRMLLSDIPFMLLTLGGLYYLQQGMAGQRGKLPLGSLLLWSSTWLRLLGIALAMGAALALVWQSRDSSVRRQALTWAAVLAIASLSTGAIWAWRSASVSTVNSGRSYDGEISQLSNRQRGDWLLDPLRNVYQSGEEIARLVTGQTLPGWLAWPLFGLPIAMGVQLSMRNGKLLWACAVTAYLVAIVLVRPPIVRYLLPISPFVLWYFLTGLQQLFCMAKVRRPAVLTLIGVGILVTMHLPRDVRLAVAVHRDDFNSFRREWPATVEMAATLRSQRRENDRFVAMHDGEVLGYLSGVPFWQVGHATAKSTPSNDAIRQMLDQEQITLVALDHSIAGQRKPFARGLTAYVLHSNEFRCVAQQGDAALYRREIRERVEPSAAGAFKARTRSDIVIGFEAT